MTNQVTTTVTVEVDLDEGTYAKAMAVVEREEFSSVHSMIQVLIDRAYDQKVGT